MSKILYAASTASHIKSFHIPYIEALRAEGHQVLTMAKGEGVDFDIPFEKKILSLKNSKCRKMIKEILRSEEFDLIILNTSLAAFHIRLAAGKRRPRIINIVHGYLFSLGSKGLKAKIKARLLLLAEQILRRKTDGIITMNNEDLKIATKYRLSLEETENCKGMGVPKKEFSCSREQIREELDSSDSFAMLFVGELSGRKNQELLIRAVPEIKSRIPNAKLWLVGDGELSEYLGELSARLGVENSVKLIGRRRNPQDYMRAADLYVSPSKIEGLPFNVAEAMSVGCTCVLSDIKGHRDMAELGGAILYAEGDISELCQKIYDVYDGRTVLMRENIAESYDRYSFEKVFLDTYEKIKRIGGV